MSLKKPEDKERKAPSNRGTINNVMQNLVVVEKMCGATFYIKKNF